LAPVAYPSQKPDIAALIIAVLAPYPYGLTTREVVELTGMTAYNASAKLSKLAASGVIEKFKIDGTHQARWRVKPRRSAPRS
jgi:DNA-binding transcriptional regulator GbsR (MarR family)